MRHIDSDLFRSGTAIWSRNGKMKGIASGAAYLCRLTGCAGLRISVRWPDGRYTFPCTKGLVFVEDKDRWQIR